MTIVVGLLSLAAAGAVGWLLIWIVDRARLGQTAHGRSAGQEIGFLALIVLLATAAFLLVTLAVNMLSDA
jgi:hypothetical protein